jgi:hypothetical protein
LQEPLAGTGGKHYTHFAAAPGLTRESLSRAGHLRSLNPEQPGWKGSHRKLEAPNHPPITFAFHDNQTIRPATVRDILCNQVGLPERDALALL